MNTFMKRVADIILKNGRYGDVKSSTKMRQEIVRKNGRYGDVKRSTKMRQEIVRKSVRRPKAGTVPALRGSLADARAGISSLGKFQASFQYNFLHYFKKINFTVLSWSLLSVEETKDKKIDFAVGGQAVIEGVMMRSPNNITIAVRKLDKTIKVKRDPYKSLIQRHKFLNIPILRGVINLFEMMIVGTKAINFSANESLEEEDQPQEDKEKTTLMKIGETLMFALSFIIAIAFSLFLFKFIPLWVTTFLEGQNSYVEQNYMVFNLIDGALKIIIFLSYIFLLSLIPSFRRIFEYHGAEHKSIFTYENKKDLTVENAKPQSRFHPRCGTSFILIVFLVSIIVYTFVPKQEPFLLNLAVRLAFLPLIAGISYEYLKISAKYSKKIFVKALIAPGLWFQRLTTKDPNEKQLEVGLKSISNILDLEKTT